MPPSRPRHTDPGSARIVNCPKWWDPNTMPEQTQLPLDMLVSLLGPEAFAKKPRTGCVLWGPPGTCKTSVALALLYLWAPCEPGQRMVAFQSFGSLMKDIRSAWKRDFGKETVADIHARMMAPFMLVLDDVGKRTTPEDAETLGTIFDDRINEGRPTILTTNSLLDTDENRAQFIASADSRTLERLTNLDINFTGLPNYRERL